MNRLKYEIVTLRNGKQYFVLEELFYEYEVYNLGLNLSDENDIVIFTNDVDNDKEIFNLVEDKELLGKICPLFEEKLNNKISEIN